MVERDFGFWNKFSACIVVERGGASELRLCGVSGVGFVSSRALIWYLARHLDPPELRDRAV